MIIFLIKNQRVDYERCFSVMQFLQSNKKFCLDAPVKMKYIDDDLIGSNGVYDFNLVYKKCIDSVAALAIQDSNSLSNFSGAFLEEINFCFYVNDMGENDDVVQLHYFELIRQASNNCYLLIESTAENYFRISDFYQIESHSDKSAYSHRYFKQVNEKKVQRFALKNNNSSRHFLPLLRTNNKTYSILSKNILEVFSFSEHNEIKSSKFMDEPLVQVIHDSHVKLLSEINAQIKKQKINFDLRKYEDALSHTSVLGFCYFMSYLYAAIHNEIFKFNPFETTRLLLQAEDFSIGTIQLLENALKHAEYGYFCYRIHFTKSKGTYLYNNYDIKPEENTAPFYLEVLISDYNEAYDIPRKFLQNLKDRYLSNYNAHPELISKFEKTLQLKDFFSPSDNCKALWQEYYADTSNIALHYGLNIFEQIIKSSSGKFILSSSTHIQLAKKETYGSVSDQRIAEASAFAHIPGTQYRIVLPINNIHFQQQSTGLKVQLDVPNLKKQWQQHTIRFIKSDSNRNITEFDIPFSTFKSETPEYKERAIEKLLEIINQKVQHANKNTILVFDVKEFSSSVQSEAFSKALICLLGDKSFEKIAIINASHQFMSMFIRVFGSLYYKKITCAFLSNCDIYICGYFNSQSENNVEIYFKGNSIFNSIFVSKQIADYKGEYSTELSVLESIAEKCEKREFRERSAKIYPFDVLVKTQNHTLFQEKTVYDLKQDLQHYHFGCRLSDVHMKVGSKIHITSDFYEATLLFGIENYISRFAYLLAKKISEKLSRKSDKLNLVLIGYETYSEILIIETQNMLEQLFKIKSQYLIYDDSAKEKKFRNTGHHTVSTTSKYVIIVPIGSTLTTHDKIAAELRREFHLQDYENILANLCVVLVKDSSEEAQLTETEALFWESIQESSVILKENYHIGSENKVDYIVSVNSNWEKPDKCKYCFPEILSDEKPILKVNKASVVPMIMMGIKEENPVHLSNKQIEISYGDISNLKKHLKYGHFKRGDNHFEYYFNTESIITDETNQDSLNRWFDEIKVILKNESKKKDCVIYNFVVAPQHTTNAAFVLRVNENVFGNPASVIFLDAKKEYRDNVKTKFSNLTQLYANLAAYGRPAIINFHYVDDTITTGGNFKRLKSFIQSLFPENSLSETTCENVKVNVFDSVILLLNRCSSDTKLSYVSYGKFFAFFELNISALRNYEDACVLCKKHCDYEDMRKLSATNSMANAFFVQANSYRVIGYNEETVFNQEDGFKRMLITHELNGRLAQLGFAKNKNETVEHMLLQSIVDILDNVFANTVFVNPNDGLCMLILVISSPFVVFRKSVLSAAFKLLLKVTEYLIFPEVRCNDTYTPNALKQHINRIENNQNKSDLKCLIKTLFTSISTLGANFVMQTKTIISFFSYIQSNFANDTVKNMCNEWIIYYCQIIIQSLMLNRQDSRVLWLEKALTSETSEYAVTMPNTNDNIQRLKQIMLLENTLILSDTLAEAVYSIRNTIKKSKNDIKERVEREIQELGMIDLLPKINNFTEISEDTDTNLLLIILFEENRMLRYKEDLLQVLKKTVKAYFCEGFRAFAQINNNSPDTEQLLNMSILYLLLLPNSSLSGQRKEHLKFYDTLLRQIQLVLRVRKVQLFITHTKTIDFICSSDGNNVDGDTKYEEYLQQIVFSSSKSIGETYYINQKNPCLNAIKIVNYSFGENNKTETEDAPTAWYLVFEVKPGLSTHELLTNARNLLVMRENLLLRLKKDYDNNLYAEFSDLRKKVKKLTDDKAGGHTPFADLSAEFDYLYGLSKASCESSNEQIANSMKFITDLLISKLYVCNINEKSYPKQIETRKTEMQYNCLKNYKNIMQCASNLVLREDNSLTIRPEISFDNVDWSAEFEFMRKSTFIWISIYYALIMNALRHGQTEAASEGNKFSPRVKIEVSTDENYLIISNKYVPQNCRNKKEGITLETVKAFFSHYNFRFEIDKSTNYTVKMPLNHNQSPHTGRNCIK